MIPTLTSKFVGLEFAPRSPGKILVVQYCKVENKLLEGA